MNYSLFLNEFQWKFSSGVGICLLESLYECMQCCRCCSHSQNLVSADTYLVIMITSPRRPLHRMHTTEKSAEKHLQRKCTVLERIVFCTLPRQCADISISHWGSHMTHLGVTAWDWVKRQPPLQHS